MSPIQHLPVNINPALVKPGALSQTERKKVPDASSPRTDAAPLTDRYAPGETPSGAGVYRVEQDEDGGRKIVFDAPVTETDSAERADNAVAYSGAEKVTERAETVSGADGSAEKVSGANGSAENVSGVNGQAENVSGVTGNEETVSGAEAEAEKALKALKENIEVLQEDLTHETDPKKEEAIQKELLEMKAKLHRVDPQEYEALGKI